ncbi:acyltransferase family protein, partial [Ideonella sp.]|uniref:acyltransferase family protein n=1 Tax=Ideonella sp. TaxID=1929293 RepID=UPI003BB4A580
MNTAPTDRLFFIDWLRILAFGLLVPYHVGMYYVTWDWHVKSPAASDAIEPLMMLSSPWRLSLLFFIGGVACQMLLRKSEAAPAAPTAPSGREGFLRRRARQLLWPLLFGMLVVVPPQAWLEVVTKLHYPGSYADFMGLYLQAYHGFCGPEKCLTLPTWNHLWFLPYLWVYSVLAWLLHRHGAALLDRLGRRLEAIQPWQLLLLPGLPLAAARMLVAQFESTHNLTWDWYNHAQYLSIFLIGLLLARSGTLRPWSALQALRWPALILAVAAWGLWLSYIQAYESIDPPQALRLAQRVMYGEMQWWAIAAACGFAVRHLNHDSAARRLLSPAVFCVYILHQT